MTKDEERLLLYCETCAVDHDGRIDIRHLNSDDVAIMEKWDHTGFVESGRIAFNSFVQQAGKRSRWCRLSDLAWLVAHRERKLRAERGWEKRRWISTAEKRGEPL